MLSTDRYLIKGGTLTEPQKAIILQQLLAARSDKGTNQSFHHGAKFPNKINGGGRRMSPIFYLPPLNAGKKLKTLFDQVPKTNILAANSYELGILRLLIMLSPDNADVRDMQAETLERLKTTCFGNADDGLGECFDTSLVVLRFLATAAPEDYPWMESRMDNYNHHVAEKKRPWYCLWYYWLCLSEIPFSLAESEIRRYKDEMLPWLTVKSYGMNSEHDKTVHPVLLCVVRNCLARLPEYAHIKEIQPFVSEKDGRLHFKSSPSILCTSHCGQIQE
jgi:hypothetical protein